MPSVLIVFCEDCGFRRHANILRACFEETLKEKLESTKTLIECKSSMVKGSFKVLFSTKEKIADNQEDAGIVVLHDKHNKTNGFGLFTTKDHVHALITQLDGLLSGVTATV